MGTDHAQGTNDHVSHVNLKDRGQRKCSREEGLSSSLEVSLISLEHS